jgi:hypothetical protein
MRYNKNEFFFNSFYFFKNIELENDKSIKNVQKQHRS